MEIQGRILKIGPVQTVGANGTFQKRELVLKNNTHNICQ